MNNLNSGYGKLHVLFDINLKCNRSEIVSVIGPNGSGKTTLLNSIFGLADIFSGSITFDGGQINGMLPHEISRAGVSYLPQMNSVFADLSVKENLKMAGYILNVKELRDTMDEVLSIFPILEPFLSRKAGTLSGGERQMLAIAMTLMRKPRLVMLDEPLAGLAPVVCQKLIEKIVDLRDRLGVGVILVEQNAKKALEISNNACLIVSGRSIFLGRPNELLRSEELVELYLGLKAERKGVSND